MGETGERVHAGKKREDSESWAPHVVVKVEFW